MRGRSPSLVHVVICKRSAPNIVVERGAPQAGFARSLRAPHLQRYALWGISMKKEVLEKLVSALINPKLSHIQVIAMTQFYLELSRGRVTPGFIYLASLYKKANSLDKLIDKINTKICKNDNASEDIIRNLSACRELTLNFEETLSQVDEYLTTEVAGKIFLSDEIEAARILFVDFSSKWSSLIEDVKLEPINLYENGIFSPPAKPCFNEETGLWNLRGVNPSFKRLQKLTEDLGGNDKSLQQAILKLREDFGPFNSKEEAIAHYELVNRQIETLGPDSPTEKFALARIFFNAN